jgi:hypothetical protein
MLSPPADQAIYGSADMSLIIKPSLPMKLVDVVELSLSAIKIEVEF